MTDKERILMHIISTITINEVGNKHNRNKSWFNGNMFSLSKKDYKKGDISVAITSSIHGINEFTVGSIEEIKDDCVVIREFGTGRLCNYYNESFYTFDRNYFSPYELLEGKQFKIYKFLDKLMNDSDSWCRFKSLQFNEDGTMARFEIREPFKDDCYESIVLDVSKSLRDIKRQINEWLAS